MEPISGSYTGYMTSMVQAEASTRVLDSAIETAETQGAAMVDLIQASGSQSGSVAGPASLDAGVYDSVALDPSLGTRIDTYA